MYLIYSLFLIISFFSWDAEATSGLKNFSEGSYIARTGKESECPSGYVKIYNEDGPKLSVAGIYIFDLRNFKERIDDDLDEAKQCFYDAEDSMDVVADSSILSFKEIHKCGELTKHILTRKLTIKKESLQLDVLQEGEGALNFSCTWVYEKRKVSSLKSMNSKAKKNNK